MFLNGNCGESDVGNEVSIVTMLLNCLHSLKDLTLAYPLIRQATFASFESKSSSQTGPPEISSIPDLIWLRLYWLN